MTTQIHCVHISSFFKCFIFLAVDGCIENSPDTAEFSREFQKHQHLFDPEHDYPALAKWVSTWSCETDWDSLVSLVELALNKQFSIELNDT